MRRGQMLMLFAGLMFIATGGFASAAALTASGAPARTVTVNVATGQRGPAGPAGPRGPAGPPGQGGGGTFSCAKDYSPGYLIINHPTGHVEIYTCLHDK